MKPSPTSLHPHPQSCARLGATYPPQITSAYLHLPPLDPRVRSLAPHRSPVPPPTISTKPPRSRTTFARASAIRLQLPRTQVKDPIANFLFERKQGHCEYFASSMAVMLRTLGIPSRVVNGFRSDEFNDITGNYVVRAKDAHSWVEAYFPGYGWQTFDPTPAGNAGLRRAGDDSRSTSTPWRRSGATGLSATTPRTNMFSAMPLSAARAVCGRKRANWARDHYDAMLQWARHSQDRVENSPVRWAVIGAAVALLLLLLGNLGRICACCTRSGYSAHPEKSPEQAAAMWYERMARAVARRGVQKPPPKRRRSLSGRLKTTGFGSPSHDSPMSTNQPASETPPTTPSACRNCTRKSN